MNYEHGDTKLFPGHGKCCVARALTREHGDAKLLPSH